LFDEFEVVIDEGLRSRKFSYIEPDRFTQLYFRFDNEHRFSPAPANMDVDGNRVVAGEEKRVAIFFENLRHHPSVHDRRLGALSAVA
jgi:hypothetical protein